MTPSSAPPSRATPQRTQRLREVRARLGLTASPHAAGSLLDGLDSLPRRMRRITARRASWRCGSPAIRRSSVVRYPGYSGLISFDVDDPRAVETATRA